MNGAELIARECVRQIEEEGWTQEHDCGHSGGELAWAAVCYAAPDKVYRRNNDQTFDNFEFCDPWPWARFWDKRSRTKQNEESTTRIACLVKAGALIAAEIDRLRCVEIQRREASNE